MGFPLRSNIFKPGTGEHRYFSRFPLQVTVLFAPNDHEFAISFRELFTHLDQITGDQVAFFAVLDPPQSWLDIAQHRQWWQEYSIRVGQSGFHYDNAILVNEIARLFGVDWKQFPVLVISPNLWNGEHVVVPTSSILLEPQLSALTDLVQEWGRPDTAQIIETIQETFSLAPSYRPGNAELQFRLVHFYEVLDTVEPARYSDNRKPSSRYWGMIRRDYRLASAILNSRLSIADTDATQPDDAIQALIADANGYLVPGAVVAAQAKLIRAADSWHIPFDWLEEESQTLLQTSLVVGEYLEMLGRMLSRDSGLEGTSRIDYAAGAQGAWKAFELEINFSLIQAARSARGVSMPGYFALYDPYLSREKARVTIPRSSPVNINSRETRLANVDTHVFITLGKAMYAVRSLLSDAHEGLGNIIQAILGHDLPSKFLDDWNVIVGIRNAGSHCQALGRDEYNASIRLAANPEHLRMLHAFKEALRH